MMDLLGGSLRLGQILGINIRIHMLFVMWVGFQLFNAGDGWRTQALWTAMLFGIVLLHELGHCLGARAVGGFANEILLWPLGGLAYAHAPMTPWAQFVTVACGPLVNVIFCIISGALLIVATGSFAAIDLWPLGGGAWYTYPEVWMYYLRLFFDINYFLLLFNMLPIYPMDGGQLFFTFIWPFVGVRRATTIACQVGLAGAVALGVWGVQSSRFILVAIAVMGGLTCMQRLQAARMGHVFDERIGTYDWVERGTRRRKRGLLARLFGKRDTLPPTRRTPPSDNPNPGGWEALLARERSLEDEVDRILQKVHDKGIQSLSYVERQTLEQATRERRERELEGHGKL